MQKSKQFVNRYGFSVEFPVEFNFEDVLHHLLFHNIVKYRFYEKW